MFIRKCSWDPIYVNLRVSINFQPFSHQVLKFQTFCFILNESNKNIILDLSKMAQLWHLENFKIK